MLAVSAPIYAEAIWQLVREIGSADRSEVLAGVASYLVRRFKRPTRERILRGLVEREEAAAERKTVRAWVAAEAAVEELRRLFKDEPLVIAVEPRLQKGVILEQGEQRVDASLRGRLQILRRVLAAD